MEEVGNNGIPPKLLSNQEPIGPTLSQVMVCPWPLRIGGTDPPNTPGPVRDPSWHRRTDVSGRTWISGRLLYLLYSKVVLPDRFSVRKLGAEVEGWVLNDGGSTRITGRSLSWRKGYNCTWLFCTPSFFILWLMTRFPTSFVKIDLQSFGPKTECKTVTDGDTTTPSDFTQKHTVLLLTVGWLGN